LWPMSWLSYLSLIKASVLKFFSLSGDRNLNLESFDSFILSKVKLSYEENNLFISLKFSFLLN
jgi:hypothetical protein